MGLLPAVKSVPRKQRRSDEYSGDASMTWTLEGALCAQWYLQYIFDYRGQGWTTGTT